MKVTAKRIPQMNVTWSDAILRLTKIQTKPDARKGLETDRVKKKKTQGRLVKNV